MWEACLALWLLHISHARPQAAHEDRMWNATDLFQSACQLSQDGCAKSEAIEQVERERVGRLEQLAVVMAPFDRLLILSSCHRLNCAPTLRCAVPGLRSRRCLSSDLILFEDVRLGEMDS